ncbi:hypothetical protein KKF32_05270 [Patescibacteria group bacterium]|nr:hypothetical protein [Patescibacteria group bacterium]
MAEPLKNKTYLNDNNFPLLISHFSDFERRRRNSFSYTKDIKSAVEWLKLILSGTVMTKEKNIYYWIDKAFEDVIEKH